MLPQTTAIPTISLTALGFDDSWNAVGNTEMSIAPSSQIEFAADGVRFEYLMNGPTGLLLPGRYRLHLNSGMDVGGCTFGLLDLRESRWLVTFHLPKDGDFQVDFTIKSSS